MGIPNKLSPMAGGGDTLPRGYLPAEFLEATGSQYIKTDFIPDNNSGISYTTETNDEIDFVGVGCRNSSTTETRFYAPRGNTKNYYGYGWGNWRTFYDTGGGFKTRAELNYKNSRVASIEQASATLETLSFTPLFPLYIFASNIAGNASLKAYCKIWNVSLTQEGNVVYDFIPTLDKTGTPCIFDKVSKQPFYNSGTGAFIVGMTPLQARNLSKLPIVESGTLTVSLPWDTQWDIGVQNALSIAATRGWTITVQYRDPEVATTPMPISFLEGTGTQYIYVPELVMTPDDDYEWHIAFSNYPDTGNFGVWSGSEHIRVRQAAVMAIEQYVFNFFGGELQSRTLESGKYSLSRNGLYINGSLKASIPTITSTESTGLYLFCQRYLNVPSYFAPVALSSFKVKGKFVCMPALDTQGVPCMYDLVTNQPFYNDGTGAFIAGFDTIEQARNLAHLPDVTAETNAAKKSLTVSLPWEAQLVITGVPAALQVAADRGWTITVQYRDPEADNAYYNKYATCTKQADMIAVNANYKADLTADGKWIYPLPKLANSAYVFQDVQISEFVLSELPELTSTYFFMAGNYALTRFYTRAPKIVHTERWFRKTSLEVFDYNGEVFNPETMLLTFSASNNLHTFNAVFGRKMGNCSYAFDGCILDKPSVLRIANSALPTASGNPFTIGVHIDLQNDTEVLDALVLMETNGWALTTQWNGTATAAAASVSTFGLRSPAIYAKLNTIEFSDGTTEQILDWGHYVTNWEERGYQEFASLEEANEYFNINQTE